MRSSEREVAKRGQRSEKGVKGDSNVRSNTEKEIQRHGAESQTAEAS